ncbi:YpdA family putative bacillithiol disulfide reductase [bacterium]|nr:MAG: YpdA family putative bacillithiol disulfide reductase [bacterium]
MNTATPLFDVIIIGAGPTGLSCAVECKKTGLNALTIEKGSLTNSIYHFPSNMIFFTTSDLLEIGDIPFSTTNPKPTREEGLNYYKRVVQHHGLNIHTFEKVVSIEKNGNEFAIQTQNQHGEVSNYRSRFVIISTGYYDQPNALNIPGEQLSKVSHYYTDPHPFFDKDVLIIGGKNSACIAALELFRYGARVTMVHRRAEIKESVKYWILPDIQNRVKEGVIKLHLNSIVTGITKTAVSIRNLYTNDSLEIKNDFVFALTGYRPNAAFLKSCNIAVDPVTFVPQHHTETLETNVEGLYVAGSVSAGINTNKLFIENGRFHGKIIAEQIAKRIM